MTTRIGTHIWLFYDLLSQSPEDMGDNAHLGEPRDEAQVSSSGSGWALSWLSSPRRRGC